jgi:hypothetical protein
VVFVNGKHMDILANMKNTSVLAKALLAMLSMVISPIAFAQKIPVPGQKNPDWALQKTEELHATDQANDQPIPVSMPSPKI